jgi:hypothetical protein
VTPGTEVSALAAQLAEIAIRNTASAVFTRIRAARTGRQQEEQLNELVAIINELVDDRNQLIGIAQGFEQELVAQRISDEDISYITEQLIPVVERMAALGGASDDGSMREMVQAVQSIVTAETLTIMQLVGFNYRQAIGLPLTELVRRMILAQAPAEKAVLDEQQLLAQRRELAVLQIVQDPEASERLNRL